jgi:outer membrane lipoprotein-sorting protein
VAFAETYRSGETHQKGELYLRKPGRMRCEYSRPRRRLFGTDGKYAYSYFPAEKPSEKSSMKMTEDKAPLAFLLGNCNLKDFREFRTEPDKPSTLIAAVPSPTLFPIPK